MYVTHFFFVAICRSFSPSQPRKSAPRLIELAEDVPRSAEEFRRRHEWLRLMSRRRHDHVPHMDGDTAWNHRGRAHAIGYMQGLMRMMDFLG